MGSNGSLDFAKYIKEEVGGGAIEDDSPVVLLVDEDDFAENTSLVDDFSEPVSPQHKQLTFDAPEVTRTEVVEFFTLICDSMTGVNFETHLKARVALQMIRDALGL